jgi:hypothetical protein
MLSWRKTWLNLSLNQIFVVFCLGYIPNVMWRYFYNVHMDWYQNKYNVNSVCCFGWYESRLWKIRVHRTIVYSIPREMQNAYFWDLRRKKENDHIFSRVKTYVDKWKCGETVRDVQAVQIKICCIMNLFSDIMKSSRIETFVARVDGWEYWEKYSDTKFKKRVWKIIIIYLISYLWRESIEWK